MEQTIKETAFGQPEPQENTFVQEETATTPNASEDKAFLEVKFNKEIKKLNLEEAATLAQKGMKLDSISEELEILKAMASEKGVGLKDFVKGLKSQSATSKIDLLKEKYKEDTELLSLLDTLNTKKQNGISELKEQFPELDEATVPQEVKAAAEISGKGLLFEYLLYEHKRNLAAKTEAAWQEKNRNESLGSVSCGANHTVDAEFLKGIWGK